MRTPPDAASAATVRRVDAEVLAELALLDPAGTTAMTGRLVALFLRDAELGLGEIISALSVDDVSTVRKLAHKLKGSAATVGARPLAAILAGMETSTRRDALVRDAHAAGSELRAVGAELQRWLEVRSRRERP